jgi:hypothetical protein
VRFNVGLGGAREHKDSLRPPTFWALSNLSPTDVSSLECWIRSSSQARFSSVR